MYYQDMENNTDLFSTRQEKPCEYMLQEYRKITFIHLV